jgi:tRNA nucleotidyltransferase (CCA-adding enzyme)
VFTHTAHCLDALVARPAWIGADPPTRCILSFAVLSHDLGKPDTTHRAEKNGRERWVSPGHDRVGGPLAVALLERLGSPIEPREPVRLLVESHHVHLNWPPEGPADSAIRRLARKLAPATLDMLAAVMEADHLGRPPVISKKTERLINHLRAAAKRLAIAEKPPDSILRGRDLLAMGLAPGPTLGRILRAAFEAQLDGAFADPEAGRVWLRGYLKDVDATDDSPGDSAPD